MAGIETSRVNLFVEKRTLVRSIVEDRRATDRGFGDESAIDGIQRLSVEMRSQLI
jgi:hypothetical protein